MKPRLISFTSLVHELQSAGLEPVVLREPPPSPGYCGVVADARKINTSLVFCALKGSHHNGHDFIKGMDNSLSLTLIDDDEYRNSHPTAGIVRVSSTRCAWAQLASFFERHPSRSLTMIGVTGTNGKTSTVTMIKSALECLGHKAASSGTIGFFIGAEWRENTHTTPDPDALFPFLCAAVQRGVTHVVMEVSSHSLMQGKVWPIKFNAAIFTSFSLDHLDFHGTMKDYLHAKMALFDKHLAPTSSAFFHAQLKPYEEVLAFTAKRKVRSALFYGSSKQGGDVDFDVEKSSNYRTGYSSVTISSLGQNDSGRFTIPMVGDVFCDNFAAAIICLSDLLGLPLQELSKHLENQRIPPVPGRLELVYNANKLCRPLVYVDYAHTPDALERAISSLSKQPKSVTTVFGCGGERDPSKRPIMGSIANRLSKKIYITNDNPRSEDPKLIVDQIKAGCTDLNTVEVILDRELAISTAIKSAQSPSIVLIAGKGHETYQLIGREKRSFSDSAVARRVIDENRTWLVLGAGMSGAAAANLLLKTGDVVFVSDDRKDVTSALEQNGAVNVSVDDISWDKIDALVISPGLALDHKAVVAATKRDKPIFTEIDLGFDRYVGSLIAVTGTNGKSTTVSMTEFLLKKLGVDAVACGNIGLPPSSLNLQSCSPDHVAVAELSSYQLEGCLPKAAKCCAFTSFSFDHLSRHKTMENYFNIKWKVASWLDHQGLFVISKDVAQFALDCGAPWPRCKTLVIGVDPPPNGLAREVTYIEIGSSKISYCGDSFDLSEFNLVGVHNQINGVISALLVQHTTNQSLKEILGVLSKYQSLPYRCQVVFRNESFKIVNDSKSTNLESTLAAMSMLDRPGILMMGGKGKGETYQPLNSLRADIAHLVLFGESRDNIAKDVRGIANVDVFKSMKEAVDFALNLAVKNGQDVIFSPGCASFDEFRDFEDRGMQFNRIVERFPFTT